MEINLEQKSVIIHSVSGTLVGILSGYLSSDPYQLSSGLILILMLIFLWITGEAVQFAFKLKKEKDSEGKKKYDMKWWMSNGGLIYMGFWLIAWIIMYNRFLIH